MATRKEYGLIFEDFSVKIVEVVVDKSQFESFCTVGLVNDLENKLKSFLNENNLHPIAIIPDTALYGCKFKETIMKDATEIEKEEYLTNYYDNYVEET